MSAYVSLAILHLTAWRIESTSHIVTRCGENGYELEGDPIWYMAVGSNSCGVTPETLADEFLREYADHPDLNRAKAEDPEYVQWFSRVADLAQEGVYLSPYSEYRDSCLPRGFIYTIGDGEERVPLPPLP